jgi:hypothetical protein
MKTMKETRRDKAMSTAKKTLPTIRDRALLEAVTGGAETVHMYAMPDPRGGQQSAAAETVHIYW